MAIRIATAFLVIGCAWILFSDRLVLHLFDDPEIHARLQLWKGWFFVIAVAVLLLFLIKGYLSRNRKLSESLYQSEERFRHIIEKSVSGICITDDNGVFEYVNPAICEIFGYSSNELVGNSISILLEEQNQQEALELHGQLVHNSDKENGTLDVIDKSGNKKKARVNTIPVYWFNGAKRLVTFVDDVTLRFNAEENIKRSEKRYRTMMEALDVPLFIANADGLIEYTNKAFSEHFGKNNVGAYCYQKIFGRDDFCDWCRDISDFKPGEKYEVEYKSDVDDRVYHVIIAAIEYEEDDIRKMVVMRDLTDIVRAKERAEESDRLKTAFLANMSHEVRTPLNAILGFSSVLNDDSLPREEKGRLIDLIHQSGLQLLNIIDDIVDVARIEQGDLRVSIMDFDLQSLLNEVMDVMKLELADGSKPELDLSMENHLPPGSTVQADPSRLKQVLMNLLGNAIKFTKKGKVSLEVSQSNDTVRFDVQDTGLGIPPDKLDVIFERFRQVDETSTRESGGNGLGLFISKNLVGQMGGSLTVHSVPGEGSVFSVILKQ